MAKRIDLHDFRCDVYDMACRLGANQEAAYEYAMGIDMDLAKRCTVEGLAKECAREYPCESIKMRQAMRVDESEGTHGKNNLLDLRQNIDVILQVRDKLLGDMECLQFRDVDEETNGYWVKVPVIDKDGEHRNAALGIYVYGGKGITVNFNSMQFFRKLPGASTYEQVMDTIDDGMEELGYKLDV